MAKKYHVTLEAIALQTRHIIDEMNGSARGIRSIYVSGSQTQNMLLMQMIANICDMPVVLPHSSSNAVVLGAAMLGRYAYEIETRHLGKEQNEVLWKIMVGSPFSFFPFSLA